MIEQAKKIGNGDFSGNPQLESEDELGEMSRGMNRMSRKIAQLLEKSVEDEREKKNLEIKMLQAQINPHFLYNTLDSMLDCSHTEKCQYCKNGNRAFRTFKKYGKGI